MQTIKILKTMKKLIFPLLLSVFIFGNAQTEKQSDVATNRQSQYQKRAHFAKLTPSERANLQTKRMTLHLDLTESQQKLVNNLLLKQNEQRNQSFEAANKNKESGKQLTDAERYQLQVGRLDSQIVFQKEMKSILNEKQYEQWKTQHKKFGKHMMMGRRYKKQQN
ncbi:MAG: hypothetical protein CO119_02110 [Flavobacteriales bacterium CG_4_9_14_3_um_filter_40_17]|nr:MAG: hypothetical protein CO119_02110 [Flavobacteriales bacterium CG_4_9_14_3_um_filter_40_17]